MSSDNNDFVLVGFSVLGIIIYASIWIKTNNYYFIYKFSIMAKPFFTYNNYFIIFL